MSSLREAYTEARAALLTHITTSLQQDERFVAAWLAGSFGRGEQRWSSDLDLHVVVADAWSETLCARPWDGGARTTEERLALFKQFGEPAVVYDAHGNNLVGGTFTYVLYRESAVNVDWMLIPQSVAYRERQTLLLFNKITLLDAPVEEPPSREECIEQASLHVGFFWMIAASNVQNHLRGDLVQFHALLQWLEGSIREVRAALKGERAQFSKESQIRIAFTLEEQIEQVRMLCDEMETLMPQVVALGGYVPSSPRPVIEMRLALLHA